MRNHARAIDLHTHSTVSDGTDTPAELVFAAARTLDVVALTDHDTTDGWDEAAAALPGGLTLLPGLELSAAAQESDRTIPLHVLGYLVDPLDPNLVAECARIRESRIQRARRMVDALVADGHPVSWERVAARARGTVGRPHLAAELVEAGLVDRVADAFTPAWIGAGGRYYRTERKAPVLQAISLIRGAGGVAVFAHPGAHGRGATVSDATITAMAAAGLQGLEIDHPDHDAETRTHLRALAADLGLLVTGSSDYHGGRRGSVLGQERTAPEVYEAIVAAGTGSAPRTG
ncbi:MAG TPA: PHP domain-containing protein [Mycobacteriales bacterium]|nr:PHP domain-containing protein [Mycobacteriales bacterium]